MNLKAIFAFAFAFWGLGLAPTRHRVGLLHGSEKVPSVCPCSMLFKPLNFSPQFEEIAPRLSLLSQKSLSKAKT
jgi:hypothetical protein